MELCALLCQLSLSIFFILCERERARERGSFFQESFEKGAHTWLNNSPLFFKVLLPAIRCVSPPPVNSVCVPTPINNLANAVKYDYEHRDFVDTLSEFLQFPQLFSNFVCSLITPPVPREKRLEIQSSAHPQASGPRKCRQVPCKTLVFNGKTKLCRFGGHNLSAAKPTTRKCPLLTQSLPKTSKYKLHLSE